VTLEISTDPSVRLAFATDASGLQMMPEGVARPDSADEVVDLVRQTAAQGVSITPAGAQTSYTGGSITDRGIVLSLRNLTKVIDIDPAARVARVQPGVLLGDFKRELATHGLLFAPDPTSEEESSLGGAIACNASGARSLKYGATRRHILGLTVVVASGETVTVRRPRLEKNTAGYIVSHDPVDWFVGSEGTLGIVVEAEVALLPLPEQVTGLGIPFPSDRDALAFIVAARESRDVTPRCLEFLDSRAFEIARTYAGDASWAPEAQALVYAEQEHGSDAPLSLDAWLAIAEAHAALGDDIHVFEGDAALRDARALRHAVPATINERAARYRPNGGRKVSTDWAVPYPRLYEALCASHDIAARHGVERSVTFGHAGNGHPHQNYVARDAQELERIESVVEDTLRHVLLMGGTVAAEHGIGKLKRRWLPLQLSEVQLAVMRAVKRELDPAGRLSPGNVFPT
jgi:FAD/FMN-containing dehydrogenase